jgi:hypothetical protein
MTEPIIYPVIEETFIHIDRAGKPDYLSLAKQHLGRMLKLGESADATAEEVMREAAVVTALAAVDMAETLRRI